MKIVTVVGARPQFIKAAAVSRKLRKMCQEILVHTGQHYDDNMSKIFFEELSIPRPNYNLNIGSGSHAKQTAGMLVEIEEILLNEKPDYLLVYGDTNSTLAGALAASKILIPILHVEAGLRSYNKLMPEEQNRILTDCLSKYLFCPTQIAVDNLAAEGIEKGVYQIGDVMCDAVLHYSQKIDMNSNGKYKPKLVSMEREAVEKIEKWYLGTIHRAENTDNIYKIKEILEAFNQLNYKVIFPIHPRTYKMVLEIKDKQHLDNILFVEPVGYMDMLYLIKNAIKVITDSGGMQKEAYLLKTPCVTIRNQTEWKETLNGNYNILANPLVNDILQKTLNTEVSFENYADYYGKGDAAQKLVEIMETL